MVGEGKCTALSQHGGIKFQLVTELPLLQCKFRPKVLQPLPDEIVARIPYEIIEKLSEEP